MEANGEEYFPASHSRVLATLFWVEKWGLVVIIKTGGVIKRGAPGEKIQSAFAVCEKSSSETEVYSFQTTRWIKC